MRINTHCERAEATDFARLIHWRVAYFRVAAAAKHRRRRRRSQTNFASAVFN